MTWNVTITGADQIVDPAALADLSAEFPFVEWGVLVAGVRGGARYPSPAWRDRLRTLSETRPMKLAVHLCGSSATAFAAGVDVSDVIRGFNRVQLNGFDPATSQALTVTTKYEVILQTRREEDLMASVKFARDRTEGRYSILFDPSGGKGLEPFRWPPPASMDVAMGYAGGINPDNVIEVMQDIVLARGILGELPTWIDMESGVRTGNLFDLAKVRAVLSVANSVNARAY